MFKRTRLSIVLFWLSIVLVQSQVTGVSSSQLKKHIEILASETMKGRYPGTAEDRLAAEYIRNQFKSAGLQLLFRDGLQQFGIVTGTELGDENYLTFDHYRTLCGTDYTPLPFSSNGMLEAGVAYIGYGIRVEHEQIKWDDYHGIDVTGKWVMILRGKPPHSNSARFLDPITEDFGKAVFAKDMGAKGVILVNQGLTNREDTLEKLTGKVGGAGIPVIQLTRETADKLLQSSNESLYNLETYHAKQRNSKSFLLKSKINAAVELKDRKIQTYNVAGMIRGQHPVHRNEFIVIGAHYDHLGMGGSGSRRPDSVAVHPGADDNASGVAAIIEIARNLSLQKRTLQRSIIFVAFGAEEKGLIGSKYFIANPPVELRNIRLLVNLDMIGRLRENNTLQLGGTGTAAEMEDIISRVFHNSTLELAKYPEGLGPSDHASFYGQDIPVLFFSTGPHMDYHTPQDTPDKIHYEGMKAITSSVLHLIMHASEGSQLLTFTEAGPKISTPRHGQQRRVSLGLMPDFTAQGIEGMRADIITKGRAADRAGMKNGDVIVGINGLPVRNLEEYMFRLSQLEAGQSIHVEIIRDEKREILLIILE